MSEYRVLALNPGSTSTRAALYFENKCEWSLEVQHPRADMEQFKSVIDQLEFREQAILHAFKGADVPTPDAVVGRGGLLAPLPGGSFIVTPPMLEDLASARFGEHPCNLGAPLARRFADRWRVPAYIADPVVTDELAEVARITGLPNIKRRSLFHALSQRGAARTAAKQCGVLYEDAKFIVAHLGGGISIGAHDLGRVIEVVNALDGEGPLSPERSGALPLLPVLEMIESGDTDISTLKESIIKNSGLLAHLKTNDLRKAQTLAESDDHAALVLDALAYNIARHIGSMGPVLLNKPGASIAAIVLTGGMARSDTLCRAIETRVSYLAPIVRVTGLEEMQTLAAGGLRVLRGETAAQEYLRPA